MPPIAAWETSLPRPAAGASRRKTHDYNAEAPDGEQAPILNVLLRDGAGARHSWARGLFFALREEGEDPRHVDSIWPIWNVLDLTPAGRGTDPGFPALDS